MKCIVKSRGKVGKHLPVKAVKEPEQESGKKYLLYKCMASKSFLVRHSLN